MVAAPNVGPIRKFNLSADQMREINPEDLHVEYDRFGDTLILSFTPEPRATVGVVMKDYALLRVDPRTNEITGLELEHFTKAAVFAYPIFAALLPLVDVPERKRRQIQRRLKIPSDQRKELDPAAFRNVLLEVFNGPPGGVTGYAGALERT